MLFNSVEFAIFLPVVFIIYWFLLSRNLKLQNMFLLAASYFFYGWWDWRFLSLIFFSSIVDYLVGIQLSKTNNEKKRKIFLLTSLLVNLGFLGFFKYFNFFTESFSTAFTFFGYSIEAARLNVILPVGISFYTFQTLSYSIDIYRRKLEPTKDVVGFFAFVSFFPQLVAGPIERAGNLLPQILRERKFDQNKAVDGVYQILWGLVKKILIADNCASLVDSIFNGSGNSASVHVLGVLLFAFQIYGDFSGYSDIAIGTAKLFGFDLMINFRMPYFSRNIGEFWHKWHISLSSWFRDYLYIPLGGSRVSKLKSIRNVFIIFIVSGFWHGANWTFIIWGALHALFFIPSFIFGTNRKYKDENLAGKGILDNLREYLSIFITFLLVNFSWIFFRAKDLNHAFKYIASIFDASFFSYPRLRGIQNSDMILSVIFILIMIVVEWNNREKNYVFENIHRKPYIYRFVILSVFSILLFFFGGSQENFIYFQF